MKTSILSIAAAAVVSLSVPSLSVASENGYRALPQRTPVARPTNQRGRHRVVYRLFRGQKKVFQNRPLALRHVSYLRSLGATAGMVKLGSRYVVSWTMAGSRSKVFATHKLAQYFQQRVRSLGFHASIPRR